MNGNTKNGADRQDNVFPEFPKESVSYCIEQLRILAVNSPRLLSLIDQIAKKLEKLLPSVQSIVVSIMKQHIDTMKAGDISMKAALGAINSHADIAANDEGSGVQKAA